MLAIAVACKDDDSPATSNAITSDEAAALVSSSIASEGLGMITGTVSEFTTSLLQSNEGGRKASCGMSDEFAINGKNDDNSEIEYSFDYAYKFELACEGDSPSTIAYDLTYNGDFATADQSITYSGLAKLDLGGLQEAAEAYAMNGTFKRSGSILDKKQNKSVSVNVELTLTSISIDKNIEQISSGTGTYSISGSVPDKGNFKYTGTIKYLGSQSAEITVSGVTFTSDLQTGTVTKK